MTTWTEPRVDTLKALFADGMSATEIAIEMGFSTRGPICGKLSRLGLQRGIRQPKQARTPRVARRARFKLSAAIDAPPTQPAPPRPAEPDSGHRCELLDLTAETCRFPVTDDGPPYQFCGEPPVNDLPYCDRHCRIAYRRHGEDA